MQGHLHHTLKRLRTTKLFGRLHKCELLKIHVDYLGFDILTDRIHASSEKKKSVVEWPTAQTLHYVTSFFVLASYYRRSIWGFSQTAWQLTDLTKAKVQWDGGSNEETNVEHLKVALASAPMRPLANLRDSSSS